MTSFHIAAMLRVLTHCHLFGDNMFFALATIRTVG